WKHRNTRGVEELYESPGRGGGAERGGAAQRGGAAERGGSGGQPASPRRSAAAPPGSPPLGGARGGYSFDPSTFDEFSAPPPSTGGIMMGGGAPTHKEQDPRGGEEGGGGGGGGSAPLAPAPIAVQSGVSRPGAPGAGGAPRPGAPSPGGPNHWSHQIIDPDYSDDNKLSVLQQRMQSRQQQRHSKSAGAMGPNRQGGAAPKGAGGTAPARETGGLAETRPPRSLLGSRAAVSASVDASAIRYRAHTTEGSPRSPRAQQEAPDNAKRQARKAGSARGGGGRARPQQREWNDDVEVDQEQIYGGKGKQKTFEEEQAEYRAMFGGGKGKGGGGDVAADDDAMMGGGAPAAQRKPKREPRRKPAPGWNSDFTEDGALGAAAAQEPAVPPRRAAKQQQRQERAPPARPGWNSEVEAPLDGGGGGGDWEERPPVQTREQQQRKGGRRPSDERRQQPQQQQRQQQAPARREPPVQPPAQEWDAPLPAKAPPAESPRLPAAQAGAGPSAGVPEGAEQASGDLIDCEHCGKSFAPATYEKICKQFNKDGERKCVAMYKKKRKVFNSAKIRIQGNEHLDKDAQKMAIKARVEVVKEKKAVEAGIKPKKKVKDDKWKKESEDFRNAMRDNRLMAKAKAEGKPITYYLK
ncbi:hypothetical protein TeGR_g9005, partial [Tetraparma gracilis]